MYEGEVQQRMATHIENLRISSYRGMKELELNNLGAVNVFVGDNNVGKTSVLEAIQLLCAPSKYNLVQIARQREKYRVGLGVGLVDSLCYLFDMSSENNKCLEFRLAGSVDGENGEVAVYGERGVQFLDVSKFHFSVAGQQSKEKMEAVDTFYGKIECSFSKYQQEGLDSDEFEINDYSRVRTGKSGQNEILKSKTILTIDHIIENAFGELIKSSKVKDKAVQLLKDEFDESIKDLRIIGNGAGYVPMVEVVTGEYVPLSLYGDGMKKALTMLNAIVNTEGGVVLIDEFETALHTSAMENVFSFVMEAASKLGVQLFLTTHSLEAVDKLLEGAGEHIDSLRVVRLRKKNEKVFSHVMNGREALENRRTYDMEIRV